MISIEKWHRCQFQKIKDSILYCELKEKRCNSNDCKEQMIE